MWIEEIFIESFGACRRVVVGGFSPGLTVVLGANEAGKSTALEFVRSVFFGFKKKSGVTNIYEAPDGTPRSGWLTVGTRSGSRIRIHRRERRGRREGRLFITDQDGNPIDPTAVPLFRAGLDRNLYENFFAFDLDAMRRLDQEALRGKIVAAALGSAVVNPLDVIRKVDDRLKSVMGRAGSAGDSILALQSRLREVEGRLRDLRDRPQQHARLKLEMEEIERRRSELVCEVHAKEAKLEELTKTLRSEEEWKRLVSLDVELALYEDARDFPTDGIVRLERADEQRTEAFLSVMELEAGLERLKSRFEAVSPDEKILALVDVIDELDTEAKRLAGLPREIDRLQSRDARVLTAVDAELSDIGTRWDRERLAGSDLTPAVEHEIREFIDLWRQRRERIAGLQPRLFECREQYKRLSASIERKRLHIERLAPLCEGALSRDSQRRLQQWLFYRNRLGDLEERLSEKAGKIRNLVVDREAVDERVRRMDRETNHVVSPALFWSLQALLGIAAAGMAAAARDADGLTVYGFASISILLILSIPGAIRWKLLRERMNRNDLSEERATSAVMRSAMIREMAEAEQDRRSTLASIREMQQSMAEITREVLGKARAGLREVLDAGKRSAKAEEPARRRRVLEDALESELADLEIEENRGREIKSLMDEAVTDFELAKGRWRDFIRSRGFDDDREPEEALAIVLRLREISSRLRDIDEDEANLTAMRAEWTDFTTGVLEVERRLYGPLGAEPDSLSAHRDGPAMQADSRSVVGPLSELHEVDPLRLIEGWSRRLGEAREKLAEKMALAERIEDRESSLGVSRKRAEEAENRIAALLEAAGVTDEEAFRARGLRHEQYGALQREREVVLRTLSSGKGRAGDHEPARDMRGYDWDAERKSARTVSLELEDLRLESEDLAGRKGRISKEIESIEAEEEFEILLAGREELRARLIRSVSEWTKLNMASILLQKTLRVYESEKQPEVLKRGSEIFGAITGGSYRRVLFPLDEDRVKVERSDGTRVDEARLSRGTLEQVFLSLRLAHLDVYHSDEVLPLMMDDILVNFDRDRASRTANALARFADDPKRQILFFTCHEHIADLFPLETKRLILAPHGLESVDAYASV